MKETEHRSFLLVPTNFDEPSERALELALDIGRALGAEVVVVHVRTLPRYPFAAEESARIRQLHEQLIEEARRRLDELAAAHAGVRTLLRTGIPLKELMLSIDELGPAMVVIGTHGRTGLRRVAAGSLTEQIVRSSSAPVMSVRVTAPGQPHARAA